MENNGDYVIGGLLSSVLAPLPSINNICSQNEACLLFCISSLKVRPTGNVQNKVLKFMNFN